MPVNVPIPYNEAANRAVRFINNLQHVKGSRWARKKFNLRPWQEAFVRRMFGTLNPDGTRQYRKAFLFIARKNGKSALASAIALYMLCGEDEPAGEIYIVAADRNQAGLIDNSARMMIAADKTLSRLCQMTPSMKRTVFTPTNSKLQAISADADHQHGYDASAVIFDELHTQPDSRLWDVMTTSQGARSQPLVLAISTAGYDKDSLCFRVYDYACKVRDGIIVDPTFLPCIYEAPAQADWKDETVWHEANPALGDFRNLDEMRDTAREALHMPARENVFRQLYLNQWVDSASRWISSEIWNASAGSVDHAKLEGEECHAGLDLAYRSDFACLSLVFKQGDEYKVLLFTFAPENGDRDWKQEPFATWKRDGLVDITPGNSTDFARIRQTIDDCRQRFNVKMLAADPWNCRQMLTELEQDGCEVIEFPQNMKNFCAPTKDFEAAVKAGKLHHGGNAVLSWMLNNTCIESDTSGNYRPSKKKSSEKVDGVIATVMALGAANATPESSEPQILIW